MKEKMRSVRVCYENGDTVTTSINGTDESISKCFAIGKPFNIGHGSNDLITEVTKVEFLD